jgi:hypothetical protein
MYVSDEVIGLMVDGRKKGRMYADFSDDIENLHVHYQNSL